MRLTSVSVRDVAGLPKLAVELQPVTAIIGPRGSGKSRLLAAISWLLSGTPPLSNEAPFPEVAADLDVGGQTRRIVRGPTSIPTGDLPPVLFLTARDRLPTPARDVLPGGDAAAAEAMVAAIAERRLSGIQGEILIIEEPELMLTPQQQRHFYALLRRYAEAPNQVIYSTRAPALLDAVHYNEIVRLDRRGGGLAVRRAPAEILSEEQRVRLEAEFDHERTEMFFATAVVLVEGQTERLSLPLIFRRLGHDPDALGISIVEVGGKGNLVLSARVLAELGIPHMLVFDSDRGRPGQRENEFIREQAGRAPIITLDPDFEAVAGIRGHDEKVLSAWRRFSRIEEGRIPRVFREIAETAVGLANSAV